MDSDIKLFKFFALKLTFSSIRRKFVSNNGSNNTAK